jgi:hypothetical protein
MNKKAIAYAVDSSVECLLQLATSIKSVRRMSPDPIDIYICTDSPRKWMEGLYGARILDVGGLAKEYGLYGTDLVWRKNDVPPMLLFRLLIPLVPELQQYDQVLYLDTDTEVWNPEFFKIFDIDRNCEIIGVRDSIGKSGAAHRIHTLRMKGGPDWKDREGITNRWDELIEKRGKYANSGVLVFNMDKFRDMDAYSDRVKYVLDKVVTLKPYYSDQDAINVYYSVYVVDDRRFDGWGRKVTDAYLRHYVGNERRKSAKYPLADPHRPSAELDSVGKNDDLGAFSGVVDNIYVLANSADKGYEEVLSLWLSSIGVAKYTKIDTSPSGKYDGLLDIVPHDNVKPEHLDNWIGHYKAIVDAIDKGYDKIAIFEDTFRPEGLENQLDTLPAGFDIAICSTGKGGFFENGSFYADSSKGYMLSRKCMLDLRRLFESLWDDKLATRRLRYVHKWLYNKILVKERGYTRR